MSRTHETHPDNSVVRRSRKSLNRTRRHRELVLLAILTALFSGFSAVAGGTTASANTPVNCANYPEVQWVWTVAGRVGFYVGYHYTLVSSVPTFNVSDSRVVDNGLDTPITVTFTSMQSQTFSLQVTVGTQASLFGFLTTSVSASIVQSRTTSIGVSVTATVPAHGRVLGQYGVEAFIVTYDADRLVRSANLANCTITESSRQTSNAPTGIEGWRLS
jgi:hypothetical protein